MSTATIILTTNWMTNLLKSLTHPMMSIQKIFKMLENLQKLAVRRHLSRTQRTKMQTWWNLCFIKGSKSKPTKSWRKEKGKSKCSSPKSRTQEASQPTPSKRIKPACLRLSPAYSPIKATKQNFSRISTFRTLRCTRSIKRYWILSWIILFWRA